MTYKYLPYADKTISRLGHQRKLFDRGKEYKQFSSYVVHAWNRIAVTGTGTQSIAIRLRRLRRLWCQRYTPLVSKSPVCLRISLIWIILDKRKTGVFIFFLLLRIWVRTLINNKVLQLVRNSYDIYSLSVCADIYAVVKLLLISFQLCLNIIRKLFRFTLTVGCERR